MRQFTHLFWTVLLSAALALGAAGCEEKQKDDDKKEEKAKKGEENEGEPSRDGDKLAESGQGEGSDKPEDKDEPPTGEVVLEEVDVAGLGNVMLPKGYEETTPATEKSGHYSLPVSEDGMTKIHIDWESAGGATNVEEGEKLIGILIGNGEVKDKKDLGDGRAKFVASRDDGTTWTVVFNKNSYLKCWGPADQAENCAKIAESLDPAE